MEYERIIYGRKVGLTWEHEMDTDKKYNIGVYESTTANPVCI